MIIYEITYNSNRNVVSKSELLKLISNMKINEDRIEILRKIA